MPKGPRAGFSTGDRVILRSTRECGIVIHAWDDAGEQDCYVAFFGESFPPTAEKPTRKPYVLRYFASSLERAASGMARSRARQKQGPMAKSARRSATRR